MKKIFFSIWMQGVKFFMRINLFSTNTSIPSLPPIIFWRSISLGMTALISSIGPSRILVKEWHDCCTVENYHYVTDAPSASPPKTHFIRHLHDQSILTLLLLKYHITPLPLGFTMDYGDRALKWHPACWQIAKKQPFLAARNASATSILRRYRNPCYQWLSWILYKLKARSHGGCMWLAKHYAKKLKP